MSNFGKALVIGLIWACIAAGAVILCLAIREAIR